MSEKLLINEKYRNKYKVTPLDNLMYLGCKDSEIEGVDTSGQEYKHKVNFFIYRSKVRDFYYEESFGLNYPIDFNEISLVDNYFLKTHSKNSYDFSFGKTESYIEKFKISYTKYIKNKGVLCFHNFYIKDFIINGFAYGFIEGFSKKTFFPGISILSPKKFEKIQLSNFTTDNLGILGVEQGESLIELNNLNIGSLVIKNSSFSKIKLNSVKIDKLFIINSNISDASFNGVTFESYSLGTNIDGEEISNISLKDSYRQLKHLMDKNGNHTEANKFYEKEMEYYKKTISYNYMGLFQALRDLSSANFQGEEAKQIGEILIISFGERINELGNNWLRPLQLILLLALTATLLDGLSNLTSLHLGINSLCSDIMTGVAFIPIMLTGDFFSNKYTKKVGSFLDTCLNNFIIFLILFLGFILLLDVYETSNSIFEGLKTFAHYLNPIYILPDSTNGVHIDYNFIELISFVAYKALYGIILWHLVVAAKRTTRR